MNLQQLTLPLYNSRHRLALTKTNGNGVGATDEANDGWNDSTSNNNFVQVSIWIHGGIIM
jgi:hypothetical protein